jgi:hypothetical protein
MRAVDKQFSTGYPPGQVDFGVYSKDADTLEAWVQRHTGPCGSPNSKAYFWDTTAKLQPATIAGRSAVSFDWDQSSCFGTATLHETALFFGTDYVFRLDWWSTDPNYSSTIQQIAAQMLSTFNG